MNIRYFGVLTLAVLFMACEKSPAPTPAGTPASNTLAGEKKTGNPSTSRIEEPCDFTKLTEVSPGVYTCTFALTKLTFTNLRVRGGWVEGELTYAENGILLSSGIARTFSYKIPSCSVSGPIVEKQSRSVTYWEYTSKASGNTWVFYNNDLSSHASFLLDPNRSLEWGETSFSGTQKTYTITTLRIGTGINMDCTQMQVNLAKFIAIRKPGSTYEYDYGIASLCYEDLPVALPPID